RFGEIENEQIELPCRGTGMSGAGWFGGVRAWWKCSGWAWPVANAAVYDADHSGAHGATVQRESADSFGVGQRGGKHELSGGALGSSGGHDYDATSGVGHVLQRHGGFAGRAAV